MQKEILTVERRQQDLAELVEIHYPKLLLPPIAFGVASSALFVYYVATANTTLLVFAILLTICFGMLLASALPTILRLSRLQRSPFDVVIDRLDSVSEGREQCNYNRLSVKEREEVLRCYGSARGRFSDLPVWTLVFQGVGTYRIPVRPHYEWSKLHAMNSLEVFEGATPGDQFYIILLQDKGRSRPMMIYHTDLFEFCADDTNRTVREFWRNSVSLE